MSLQLGRYILDRKIATGGMADVFLSRQSGPEGYERPCVIKRMLSQFAEDPIFVNMFLDEARLAAQLTHPNIAQIYDFGAEHGQYYIAMEYVPGATLRDVLQQQGDAGRYVPFRVAARVMSDAARGLEYAHTARDGNGKHLEIIHRDISPHNILVSRGGQIKLIDFGIAKAKSANTKTNVGTIKGKYAYMSPEQVMGHPLDRRTDIYSLGLVFYEVLTNNRAILGDDLMRLMEAAARPHFVPLLEVRPDIPQPLVDACMRALEPNKAARYGTASELSSELERYLVNEQVTVSDDDVASLLPDSQSAPTIPPDNTALDPLARTAQTQPSKPNGGQRPQEVVIEPTLLRKSQPAAQQQQDEELARQAVRPSRAPLIAVIALLLIGGGGGAAWWFLRSPPPPAPTPDPPIAVAPTPPPVTVPAPPPLKPVVAPTPEPAPPP
ncbi:MAG TPA: serine/threonine-protein kinase, partial [Myxococcaceae bacterium]|nr:serine/threonine-protein kinase [Myxococcaceae bacterium]